MATTAGTKESIEGLGVVRFDVFVEDPELRSIALGVGATLEEATDAAALDFLAERDLGDHAAGTRRAEVHFKDAEGNCVGFESLPIAKVRKAIIRKATYRALTDAFASECHLERNLAYVSLHQAEALNGDDAEILRRARLDQRIYRREIDRRLAALDG